MSFGFNWSWSKCYCAQNLINHGIKKLKYKKSEDDEDDDDDHNDEHDDDTHDDDDQVDDFNDFDDDDDDDDDDENKLEELCKKLCVPLSATWPALPSPPPSPHSS